MDVVDKLGKDVPILGVCLGHQAIVQSLGGQIVSAPTPIHGRSTQITHDQSGIFDQLPASFTVGRYHSLVGERQSLPECLKITAETSDGIIMAVRHRRHPIVGVQFHPESILTEHGYLMLGNFAKLAGLVPQPIVGVNV